MCEGVGLCFLCLLFDSFPSVGLLCLIRRHEFLLYLVFHYYSLEACLFLTKDRKGVDLGESIVGKRQ